MIEVIFFCLKDSNTTGDLVCQTTLADIKKIENFKAINQSANLRVLWIQFINVIY